MRNDKFELPDALNNATKYFKHIIKKHETVTDNPPI